jgi:hypothetical protein
VRRAPEVDRRLALNAHPEHDEDLPVIETLDAIVALVDRHPEVFVRYSHGPRSDRTAQSRDYESGLDLPGLSVTVATPEPWWTRPIADWVARRLCKYAELADRDRFPWLLTGEVVGRGPDHEPLVELGEALARVGSRAMEEARRVYEERFDVGQSSAT